jgi:hypothetical protein
MIVLNFQHWQTRSQKMIKPEATRGPKYLMQHSLYFFYFFRTGEAIQAALPGARIWIGLTEGSQTKPRFT